MRSRTLVAALVALALGAVAPALGDDRKKGGPGGAQDPLAALAEKTGAPLQALKDTKAERLLSSDPNERRAYLKDIAQKPREDLLGVVAHMALNDPDVRTQIAATACVSCFALLADRDDVLRLVRPVCEAGIKKGQQFARHGIDELVRLNKWFRWDMEIAPILKGVFDGDDFNLRSFAFRGICDFRNAKLVEELVKPVCWKVYRSKTVSLFDRREAIRTLVELGDRAIVPEMQHNLRNDGRVAIESAWGLVKMPDPTSLAELRRIDMTAVHALRKPTWLARCILDDPTCLEEIVRVVQNKLEHAEIKRSFTTALGEMPTQPAKAALEKLWATDWGESTTAVRRGAALGLLNLGDARGIDLLEAMLLGPWPDDLSLRFQGHGWMCQLRFMDDILRVRNGTVGPLLVAMTKVAVPDHKDRYDKDGKEKWVDWRRHGTERSELLTDWYDEYRADAVSQCGEYGLKDTLPRLRELSAFEAKIGHMKFHALVSRWELEDKYALRDLERFLPYYDDSLMKDIWVQAGSTEIRTERLKWSSIFDVCFKAQRKKEERYLELLELLLRTRASSDDPMSAGWAKKIAGGKPLEGGTVGRGEKSPLESPPEVEYLCRNQFVRRAIALAAARIAGEKAAPQLARALRDSRAVVRAAALEQIGRLSGKYTLDIGATADEEHKVFAQAAAWLKEKGAWPE